MRKKYAKRGIPTEPFERMKILAQVNRFELRSEQDVFRICYLADTFREVYGIGNMRPLHRKNTRWG